MLSNLLESFSGYTLDKANFLSLQKFKKINISYATHCLDLVFKGAIEYCSGNSKKEILCPRPRPKRYTLILIMGGT